MMNEQSPAGGAMPEIPKVDFKNVNADALKGGFGDIISILKLDKTAIDRVAHRDTEGVSLALVYLMIGALGAPLGGMLIGYTFFNVTVRTPFVNAIIGGVLAIVLSAVVLYVTSLVAQKMFQGQAKFDQYFRVMGYASIVNVVAFLTFLPILATLAQIWILVVNYFALTLVHNLATLAQIWILVVNYFALTLVHKLNSTNAVLTIIVTIVAFIVLTGIIASLGLTAIGLGAGAASIPSVSLSTPM